MKIEAKGGSSMLILTRRLGESITIGQNIKIVVIDINSNQVKIGIEAPRDIEIYREEIYDKINNIHYSNNNKFKKSEKDYKKREG